ncbi:cytochrome-c peroxidase [Thiocapsa imhoffii]|uniref:Cytochrome-c peroxidase n=1 Tax=Thiocapsa imhoffii TaxID=382777 RepID=A0A9X0WKH0_9GAMM|nr:cytochrome c peroxidase [Thiocapsa imhoffii]MBK1646411.1 cytochrome-c peroxidase [Thiocapsa imhoffii]
MMKKRDLIPGLLLLSSPWLSTALADTTPASATPSALPPVTHPADNPGTPEKIALGHQLFVDPRLSASGEMSCQGCHYHHLGWTDGKVLSPKDNGELNTRHTPTLYNVGYQTAWYWDGRATSLEGQILAAWRAQINADPEVVTERINAAPEYVEQFQEVFGTSATPETVVQALAAYLRTKNSDDSPWDRYERGQSDAVSADAIAGYDLFVGKAGCAACHAPPYYGNSTFFNIGLEYGKADPDPGRFNVTQDEADRGAFKTPTLRSVALSAPYFHDGSRATLVEAVTYMASGGGQDPQQSELLVDRGLSDVEIAQLVAFLESLTSEEPWEAPAIPE